MQEIQAFDCFRCLADRRHSDETDWDEKASIKPIFGCPSRSSSGYKDSINEDINLLIIEARHPLNQRRLSGRMLVPPQYIFMLLAIDNYAVVVRYAFVRASSPIVAISDILPIDLDSL